MKPIGFLNPNLRSATMRYKIQVYRDKRKEFRWRLVDNRNHKIIDSSSEGYKRRGGLINNLIKVQLGFKIGVLEDLTQKPKGRKP